MDNVKNGSDRFKDAYVQIGIKIGYYRKLRGYTQEQLVEKAKMSAGYLSQIEAPGMVVMPSLETLLSIAEALDIPVSKLFEFEAI